MTKKKKVSFSAIVVEWRIPAKCESRDGSSWMMDRMRFQRRITEFEKMYAAIWKN
jgi:hypothetical protein